MDQSKSNKQKYANNKQKSKKKQFPIRYFPRHSGLIGLTNLGNTCYMNSALQALSNCPQLTSYMLENFESLKPGLAKNFALLLYEIWVHGCFFDYTINNNHLNQSKVFYDYLSPSSILFGIKNACPNFRSSAQQEDAQEFLRCFLDTIHEELKIPINQSINNSLEEENKENLSIYNSKDDEIIDNLMFNLNDHKIENHNEENKENHINNNLVQNHINDDNLIENHINNDNLVQNHINYNDKENHIDDKEIKLIDFNGHDEQLCKQDNSLTNQHSTNGINLKNYELNNDLKDQQLNHKSTVNSLQNYPLNKENELINRIPTLGVGDVNIWQNDENCVNKSNNLINEFDENESDEKLNNYSDSNSVKQNEEELDDVTAENSKNLKIIINDQLNKSKKSSIPLNDKKEKIEYESIISKIFDGEILNSVQCLTCKNVSTIKETFQDLSLPIPNKEDLLQSRQINENYQRLNSDNQIKNSKNKKIKDKKNVNKIKNGLIYRRLDNNDDDLSENDNQNNDNTKLLNLTSFFNTRIIRLPIIKYFFIILLYINYFLKSYIINSLISFFYWSQSNLWGPTITLNDCLDAFFSTDELKDNNMYSCDKCKKKCNGIKFTNLIKSPDILCIHFKRFRNELMFPSKISTYVSFPLKDLQIITHQIVPQNNDESFKLANNQSINNSNNSILSTNKTNNSINKISQDSLNNSLNNSNSNNKNFKIKRQTEFYDLVSVICHKGHYSSGHYITYALNCLDYCWYEYDDKAVRKIDENKVLNCEAYVLFYKKNTDLSTELLTTDEEDYDSDNESQLTSSTNDEELILDRSFKNYINKLDKNEFYNNKLNTKSDLFRKRKYFKIIGEIDYNNEMNDDILGDIKL